QLVDAPLPRDDERAYRRARGYARAAGRAPRHGRAAADTAARRDPRSREGDPGVLRPIGRYAPAAGFARRRPRPPRRERRRLRLLGGAAADGAGAASTSVVSSTGGGGGGASERTIASGTREIIPVGLTYSSLMRRSRRVTARAGPAWLDPRPTRAPAAPATASTGPAAVASGRGTTRLRRGRARERPGGQPVKGDAERGGDVAHRVKGAVVRHDLEHVARARAGEPHARAHGDPEIAPVTDAGGWRAVEELGAESG